jgi:hypothetical protein
MLALAQPLGILLQRNFNNPPPPGPGAGEWAMIIAFYVGLIVIGYVIRIFFLLTLSKCLKEIAPKNRQMEPGQVWLALIPIFDVIWIIIIAIRLADSLKDEYEDRGLTGDGDFGKTLGIVYIVSAFICGCVSLVCFIMYWVKIAGYSRTLRETGRRRGDDFDDDRPRRRIRDDEDDDRGYRDVRDER